MKPLTPRQQECMVFIEAHLKNHGISPTYAEIGAALGIKSKHGVSNLIDTLAWAGRLTRNYQRARSIQLLPTEDHHAPRCDCLRCCHARYLKDLKLVQALDVPVEIAPGIVLVGLRTLPRLEARPKSRVKSAHIHNSHSIPASSVSSCANKGI